MSASKILMKRRLLEEAKQKKGAAMAKGEQPSQTGGWPCQKCGYGHEVGTSCPQKQKNAARPVSGTEPKADPCPKCKIGTMQLQRREFINTLYWLCNVCSYERPTQAAAVSGIEESAVPPVPEVFARNFLNGNLWLSSDTETEEINAIVVLLRNYVKHLATAAAPSLTPRCPKCNSHRIEIHYGLYIPDGTISPHQAICRDCLHGTGAAQKLADFAQFFSAQEGQ